MECAIAPSAGDAKARFICSEDKTLDSLLPYLTRTIATHTFDHDLAIEIRPNIIGLWASQRRSPISDSLSNALSSAAPLLPLLAPCRRMVRHFASELHGVTLAMDLDARGARSEIHLTTKKARRPFRKCF